MFAGDLLGLPIPDAGPIASGRAGQQRAHSATGRPNYPTVTSFSSAA